MNEQRFIEAFNSLHDLLTKILHTSDKKDFFACLGDIQYRAKNDPFFATIDRKFFDSLRTINSIRNILVHKNDWIEIPESTIALISNITKAITLLEHNFAKNAIEIFWKKVYTIRDTDTIKSVIETMKNRNFSHVPVYRESWEFRGVFSMRSLIFWLSNTNNSIDLTTKISDVSIDTHESEYIFMDKNSLVSSIEKVFHDYAIKRKKLGAIFLTKSGSASDPIEGIITAWDMPLISEQIS